MATSKELAELIIERPASTTRTERLERSIEEQAEKIWMLTQDDDGDGITATGDLKERLEKDCWNYYHLLNKRGRKANPGEGTEWSSNYGEAFAEAVASFDPMKANWDNPCKFLTHLETKFKNIRDRASTDEFAQERDRVSLDKLAGTPSKQADDDGLPEDEENLLDDEDVSRDGDDDGLRDDEEGGLASNDDDGLPDDGEDLLDVEDGLPDSEEDGLSSDDGELVGDDEPSGDDDAQADYVDGLQSDADPLQQMVGDSAHADYLYSLYWDMARLVIEFTEHQTDKAHNDDAKLFRRMCFTDKTTILVKRQERYNDCWFVERHWSNALEAMEQGFLDFYMLSPCATVKSLRKTPIKEDYRFAAVSGASGGIGMLEAWAVLNDAYSDYIESRGKKRPSRPRVSQRKNEFSSLMFESKDICRAYVEHGFIVVKEDGIRKAVRSEDYKVGIKNGTRRAYHRGLIDPRWAPKKRADQLTDGRRRLMELHDRVGRKEFGLVATLLEQEAGYTRWGQKIVELLRRDGTSGTSRRDRQAFSECLDAIVASDEQYVRALGGSLLRMASNSQKLGESGRWAALRCCKAVLDAYELGKMDRPNATFAMAKARCIMERGASTATEYRMTYWPFLEPTPEEQGIIDAIKSDRRLAAGSQALRNLRCNVALDTFFGDSRTWRPFRSAGVPVGFWLLMASLGEPFGLEELGAVFYTGVSGRTYLSAAEWCYLQARSDGGHGYGNLALIYDNGASHRLAGARVVALNGGWAYKIAREVHAHDKARCPDDVTFVLAMRLRDGIGCRKSKKNEDEARGLLRELCDRDYRDAFYELGSMCLKKGKKKEASRVLARGALLNVPLCAELFTANGLEIPSLEVIYDASDFRP